MEIRRTILHALTSRKALPSLISQWSTCLDIKDTSVLIYNTKKYLDIKDSSCLLDSLNIFGWFSTKLQLKPLRTNYKNNFNGKMSQKKVCKSTTGQEQLSTYIFINIRYALYSLHIICTLIIPTYLVYPSFLYLVIRSHMAWGEPWLMALK